MSTSLLINSCFFRLSRKIIYFDDLSITTRKTITTENFDLIQADDYYPYGLAIQGNMLTNDEEDEPNNFLYQGKEWQTQLALNLYDFHARQYDPATGRFLGVDPQDQFMSGYVGMGNNPMMMVDPDGELAFLAVALKAVVKLAWAGTKIAAASYTAQVALSPGGFDNWDGDQFKKALLKGAISGVVTGGIGNTFKGVDKFGEGFNLKKELFRAVTHASANTLIGASFGDEVNGGTFLASFGGSFAGSLMQGAGFNKFETIAASAVLAGGIAEISGKGDFLRAAGASVTVSYLNHFGEHGGGGKGNARAEWNRRFYSFRSTAINKGYLAAIKEFFIPSVKIF